jgi:GNAT superfamily N-acetyltransferase
MQHIRFIPESELEQIIPLLLLINPDSTATTMHERLQHMKQYNYRCLGVYNDDKLIAICGLWHLYKHYSGKHLEPDNVVVLPEYRGKGIGAQMMQWIYTYAKAEGCMTIELNVYVENEDAHRFWKKEGFRHLGHHYQKKLE